MILRVLRGRFHITVIKFQQQKGISNFYFYGSFWVLDPLGWILEFRDHNRLDRIVGSLENRTEFSVRVQFERTEIFSDFFDIIFRIYPGISIGYVRL